MIFSITAISFSTASILAGVIAWRGFYVWKRQRDNRISEMFFYTLLSIFLYMALRAILSIFFLEFSDILTWGYILSHVFLAFGASYLVRFTVASFFNFEMARKVFYLLLIFFAIDIILNIFLPNQPRFNEELNIIEWGTNKYVGIYHTFLLWLSFLCAAFIFTIKAIKNWKDYEVRTRSITIASGLFLSIIVIIPRNIFHNPIFILVSDIGYILSLGLILLGVSFGFKKAEENLVNFHG